MDPTCSSLEEHCLEDRVWFNKLLPLIMGAPSPLDVWVPCEGFASVAKVTYFLALSDWSLACLSSLSGLGLLSTASTLEMVS